MSRLRRIAKNPLRNKSPANRITAHSESVGTGGVAAAMIKVATAGTVLKPLLVESAVTPIVLV